MYGKSFDHDGDASEGDDQLVSDDELLVDGAPGSTEAGSPGQRRFSRRVPRSGLPAGAARTGDLIANKYLVEGLRGRFGPEIVVYARHLELGQRVLLRYLSPEASASPEAVARFQRGARRAREMKSEQAERVLDFGRLETGSAYRVTELPAGPSLAEIVRVRGALEVGEAVDVIVAACEPVAEAHASGMMHRSLSMGNIYIERRADGSQLVKVLDFGVADPLQAESLAAGGLSVSGQAPGADGSLAFASPEQIRNPSAVDARADVWALGAILYELLTGVRVFEAETPLTLLAMIAADQPAPIRWLKPEVPETLERIVLACLEKDPEGRPRSVVELAGLLSPYGTRDSEAVVSRIARIATRTTRPPPLPSTIPPGAPSSFRPGTSRIPGSMRTQAIVRSSPVTAAPEPTRLPGWALLVGGGLIGMTAALAAALFLRPAGMPAAQTQPRAEEAAAAPAPAAALPNQATGARAAPATPTPARAAQGATPAAAAPLAAAPAPRPASKPRPKPRAEREEAPGPAPEAQAAAAKPAPQPPAKALFGSLD